MKTRKIGKTSAILCVIALIACILLINVWFASADDDWKLFYWSFENSLADESGSLTSGTEGTFAAGKKGQALNVAESGALKSSEIKIDTTKGFTMSAWILLNSGAEGYNIIMSHGNTMSNNDLNRFQVHIAQAGADFGGGFVKVFAPAVDPVAFPKEEDLDENSSSFVPYDTWTHIAVTFNGDISVLYVNGTEAARWSASSSIESGSAFYDKITIGALNHDAQTFTFNGLIDEAVFANYPMKISEISLMASDPSAAAIKLSSLAKGSEKIEPDNIVMPSATTDPDATEKPNKGGKTVYYWPMQDDAVDISHKELDFDYNDIGLEIVKGVNGNGIETANGGAMTDVLDDMNLSCFTISFWTKLYSTAHDKYGVLFAMAGKENPYHIEIYTTWDDDKENANIAFYNTGSYFLEGLAAIKPEENNHIVFTYDDEKLSLFLNGEKVLSTPMALQLKGMGSGEDSFVLGSLADSTLACEAMFDEVIFADYVFDEALITKLYSNPSEAANDVIALVEANYPENYTRPTKAPEATATASPETTATPDAKPTSSSSLNTPSKNTPANTSAALSEKNNDNTTSVIIIVIVVTVVIIAAAIAALFIVKKKAKK